LLAQARYPARQDRHHRHGLPPRACGTATSVSGPTALGTLRWQAVRPRSARRTATEWFWPRGAF